MPETKKPIGPPPSKTRRLALDLPVPAAVPDNLSTPNDEISDLNFKVPSTLKVQFKGEAVARGWSMRKLLETSFRSFLDEHGASYYTDSPYVEHKNYKRRS